MSCAHVQHLDWRKRVYWRKPKVPSSSQSFTSVANGHIDWSNLPFWQYLYRWKGRLVQAQTGTIFLWALILLFPLARLSPLQLYQSCPLFLKWFVVPQIGFYQERCSAVHLYYCTASEWISNVWILFKAGKQRFSVFRFSVVFFVDWLKVAR